MPLRLSRLEEVIRNVEVLPSRRHMTQAMSFMYKLKEKPFLGQSLEYKEGLGNLGDCRKVYFSDRPTKRPDYRIVYMLLPDEEDPTEVRIVAVGKREDEEVYKEAAKRLGRK